MIITVEALKKYGAPEGYIEELGADTEFLDILKRPAPTTDFLHFIVKYFSLSADELYEYFQKLEIVNSYNVYTSDHIKNSAYVVRSAFVDNSNVVMDSYSISKSQHIYSCKDVKRSTEILNSNIVECSNEVYFSNDISYCSNISRSTNCDWSNNIFQSRNINESYFIYLSDNCQNSAFLGFCHKVSHCLFCSGLEGAQWMIFNESVEPALYMYYEDALRDKLERENTHIYMINPYENYMPNDRYTIKMRPDVIFDGLSADFYGWISQLPGYTDEKFLGLFSHLQIFEKSLNLIYNVYVRLREVVFSFPPPLSYKY